MPNQPRLEVIKQTALQEDRATKNGVTMNVFVVVKNSPFQLVLCLKNATAQHNFNHLAFDMKLLYDMEGEKEVSYLKTKPIDYKPAINDVGDQITFDVKIKVLSSHHEDNFFRLKTVVWDPANPEMQMSTLSYPIKVISKPLKHRRPSSTVKAEDGAIGEAPAKQFKRSYSDRENNPIDQEDIQFLHAKLNELLEEQQQTRDEVRLLRQLLQHQQHQISVPQQSAASSLQPMLNGLNGSDMEFVGHVNKKIKQEETDTSTTTTNTAHQRTELVEILHDRDIEGMMSRMLQIYSTMELEDKTERVRRMLRNMSARDAEQLVELIDLLNAHGLQHEAQKSMYGLGQTYTMGTMTTTMGVPAQGMGPHGHTVPCGTDCPHKLELSRLDQFYNEVFF